MSLYVYNHHYLIILYCCYLCTVAIDMSPAQNAMLEIKLAAIQHLEYHDYLCLLGEQAEGQDSFSRYM